MATKKPPMNQSMSTYLRVTREDAGLRISNQIIAGQNLLARPIHSRGELDALDADQEIWSSYNSELLQTLFTTHKYFDEYSYFGGSAISMNPSLSDLVEYSHSSIKTKITRLQAIGAKLDLVELLPTVETRDAPELPATTAGNDVFIVHGHNNELKQTVARLLEKQKIAVKILHELPDGGRTIIEKFEHYSGVGYAVVLLTPDDVGASRSAFERDGTAVLQGRARPNVLLELGYFLAKLGRSRVSSLRLNDTELPSDISGVMYTSVDPDGAWRYKLLKEMRNAGFIVDLNLID